MAHDIDVWFAVSLIVVGLSHAAQPQRWMDFFQGIKATGHAPFLIALPTLSLGLLIIQGHNQWVWDWPVLVTLAGWGMTMKATIYLIVPTVTDRVIANAGRWQKAFNVFRVVGIVMFALGAVLSWRVSGPIQV